MTINFTDTNEFQETEVGPIPANWRMEELGEMAEYLNGAAFKPSDWATTGLPIIRIQNLTGSSNTFNYFEGILPERYQIKNGDLLISWSASLGAFIWKGGDAWLNQHIFKVNNISPQVHKLFLFFAVQHHIDLLANQTRGSTMKHIVRKAFLATRIPLPPLPEQRRIAIVLNAIQEAIAVQDDVIAAVRAFKRSLMQRLFTYGPDQEPAETEETEIGEIPAHWNLEKLKNLVRQKITDGTHHTPTYVEKGIPFLRVTDIKSEKIDWANAKYIPEEEHKELIRRCKPERNDVLLSKNGTIGRTKVVDWDEDFSIFVSLCLIKPRQEILDSYYLANYIASNGMPQVLERGKKVTVTNLHLVEINELYIPVPAPEEQKRIAEMIKAVNSKIAAEEDRKTTLQTFLKTLLHQLMTGQLRLLSDEGLPL